jgi:lysophospholipase L1-like esterase
MKVFTIFLSVGFLMLLFYGVGSYYYYHHQGFPFEPFVQIVFNKYDSLEIQNDDLVILCLGGSTTNDGRLQEAEKYPSQLQKILESKFQGKRIYVLNGGMDWYTSKHSLINYTTYYRKFKPDVVIVMHAINDICRSFTPVDFSNGEYTSTYSHYYGPAINAAKPPSMERFLIRKRLGDFRYQQQFNPVRITSYSDAAFCSFDAFRFYMNELQSRIVSDSALCFFVEQPSFYQPINSEPVEQRLWFGRALCNNGKTYPDGASMFRAMRKFNGCTQQLCETNNVSYITTKQVFPIDTFHLKDDVHHTPKGAALLAGIVADKLFNNPKFIMLSKSGLKENNYSEQLTVE